MLGVVVSILVLLIFTGLILPPVFGFHKVGHIPDIEGKCVPAPGLPCSEDNDTKKKEKQSKPKKEIKKKTTKSKKDNSVKFAKPETKKPKMKTPATPQTPVLDGTGNWESTASWSASFEYWDPDLGLYKEVCQFTGNLVFNLQQNGNVVTGTAQVTNAQLIGATRAEACNVHGFNLEGPVNANIFGSGFSGTVGVLNISGSFTSDLIRGKVVGSLAGEVDIGGEFVGHRIK